MLRDNALCMSKHREKQQISLAKKRNGSSSKTKVIVQKDGLHFAGLHNARGLRDDRFKNNTNVSPVCNTYLLEHIQVTQQ